MASPSCRIPSIFVSTKPTRCGWRSIIRYCRLRELRRLYSRFSRAAKRPKDLAWFAWMALAGLFSLPLASTCQIRVRSKIQHVDGEAVVRSIPGLSVVSGRYPKQALRLESARDPRMCHAVDSSTIVAAFEEPWVVTAGPPFHVHRPAARVPVLKVQQPSRVKLFKHFTAC
jgi:hypothetical protein